MENDLNLFAKTTSNSYQGKLAKLSAVCPELALLSLSLFDQKMLRNFDKFLKYHWQSKWKQRSNGKNIQHDGKYDKLYIENRIKIWLMTK